MNKRILGIFTSEYAFLYLFILSHVVAWSFGPFVTHDLLDSKLDMLENFVWGMNPEWGYYKHPPLFAFVSYNWLKIFGINNFSYFLLSQVNIAIGMVAIFFLSRIFLDVRRSILAVCLLEFIVCYNTLGIKFNANSILLSLFPLSTLFFVRGIKFNKLLDWLLCGAFMALCFLSKYYSIVLVLSFALVVLLTQKTIWAFKNYRVYLAVALCFAILLPHILWLIKTDFMVLKYIDSNINKGFPVKPIKFLLTNIGYVLIAFLLIAVKSRSKKISPKDENLRILLILSLTPSVITFVIGMLLNLETSSVWGIPNCFAFSILICYLFQISDIRTKVLQYVAIALNCIIILVSIVNITSLHVTFKKYKYDIESMVLQSTSYWGQKTNNKPLKYITGDSFYAYHIAFYSQEHPHVLINFDFTISPWIKDDDILRDGILAVCHTEECKVKAEKLAAVFPNSTVLLDI